MLLFSPANKDREPRYETTVHNVGFKSESSTGCLYSCTHVPHDTSDATPGSRQLPDAIRVVSNALITHDPATV